MGFQKMLLTIDSKSADANPAQNVIFADRACVFFVARIGNEVSILWIQAEHVPECVGTWLRRLFGGS